MTVMSVSMPSLRPASIVIVQEKSCAGPTAMTSAGTNRYCAGARRRAAGASSASARARSFGEGLSSLRSASFSSGRRSAPAWSRMSDHQLPAPVIGENTVAATRSRPPRTLDATVAHARERTLAAAQVEDDEGQRRDDEHRKEDAGAARQHGDSALLSDARHGDAGATPRERTCALAARLRDEDLLQRLELLDALARAERDAVERVGRR